MKNVSSKHKTFVQGGRHVADKNEEKLITLQKEIKYLKEYITYSHLDYLGKVLSMSLRE